MTLFYHIGYRASFLFQRGNEYDDESFKRKFPNTEDRESTEAETLIQNLEKYNRMQCFIGHGLYQSFGFNIAWDRIGMGFEHCWSKGIKYKNQTKKSIFGGSDISYKFETTTNRIYLSYRFGK